MEGTITTAVEVKPGPWRRWLNYALQAVWIVAAVFIVELLVVSTRPGYLELLKVCTEPVCPSGQITPEGVASLARLGISLSAYAIIQLVIILGIALIYAVISLLIFRARRHDNIALYVAIVLLLFGTFESTYVDVLSVVRPGVATLIGILPGATLIAFTILCYVFPDGRFVPRWTRWAAWGWIAAPLTLMTSMIFDVYEVIVGPLSIVLLVLLATCVIAPIMRYRKLASRVQRQQLKWALFGLAQLLATILIVVELLPMFYPRLDVPGTLPNIISNLVQSVSLILFPMSIGIAMLRYRLWNVDLVINRTLVYVPLTSILTVIYTTSLAVSQRLFVTPSGEQSQAVAIFTTIVLTTTFSPIKNALQSYVDRNFKEAPGNLSELKELNRQVTQVVQAFDYTSLAQRVVETVVHAHNAQGAALYLFEGKKPHLVYATPQWMGVEGELSILLMQDNVTYGRLLLGQRNDRDDYTLGEIEQIRETTLPIVRNMHTLAHFQANSQSASQASLQNEGAPSRR